MRKIIISFLSIFLIIGGIAFTFLRLINNQEKSSTITKIKMPNKKDDGVFLSQYQDVSNISDYFHEAISYWPKKSASGFENKKSESKITAGIIPHHLPASPMIANFFSQVGTQNVDTIYILTPNHDESGDCKVVTTNKIPIKFQSNTIDNITINQNTTNTLLDLSFVCTKEDLIKNEHAINILLPYISYYLQNPKIVTLAISNYLSMNEIDELDKTINYNKTKNDIIVASVDFSHYLTQEKANQKDQETISLIKNKNYEKLLGLDHEHLDSPESVITLMKVLEENNINKFTILAHENFVSMSDDKTQPSTSYFEIVW